MSTPTIIGVAIPGGTYAARWLHWGGAPEQLIPTLRTIWQDTYACDTAALVEALQACDWVELDPAPGRRRGQRTIRVVPGVGYASTTAVTTLGQEPSTGSLTGEAAADLQWLYLIDPDTHAVTVYQATRTDHWLRHSLHDLAVDTDGELFACHPGVLCLTCGAIDLTDHVELPSMTGAGTDSSTRCLRCGAVEAFDPMFGWHRTTVPWPPADTPDTPA